MMKTWGLSFVGELGLTVFNINIYYYTGSSSKLVIVRCWILLTTVVFSTDQTDLNVWVVTFSPACYFSKLALVSLATLLETVLTKQSKRFDMTWIERPSFPLHQIN